MATYLALRCQRRAATAGVCLEKCTRPRKKTPPTGRVPATRGGIRSQDTSANKRNPAQARIFKPQPHPEKPPQKQTKRKTFGFVVMYSDFMWRQSDVHQVPQTCRTGCWRPGAGVKGQGQVFELGGGGANSVSLCVCVCVCVVMFQSASFCDCCVCVWTLN